jgi:hypothetical protein
MVRTMKDLLTQFILVGAIELLCGGYYYARANQEQDNNKTAQDVINIIVGLPGKNGGTQSSKMIADIVTSVRYLEKQNYTIDEGVIGQKLISLLEDQDDTIRYYSAYVIAHLAPNFRDAIPALNKALLEAKLWHCIDGLPFCMGYKTSSADPICDALKRIDPGVVREKCIERGIR